MYDLFVYIFININRFNKRLNICEIKMFCIFKIIIIRILKHYDIKICFKSQIFIEISITRHVTFINNVFNIKTIVLE